MSPAAAPLSTASFESAGGCELGRRVRVGADLPLCAASGLARSCTERRASRRPPSFSRPQPCCNYGLRIGESATKTFDCVSGDDHLSTTPSRPRRRSDGHRNTAISGVGPVSVECPSDSRSRRAGPLTCSYSSDLPDGSDRLNTATATTHLGADRRLVRAAPMSPSADPTNKVDECITVTDDRAGELARPASVSRRRRSTTRRRSVRRPRGVRRSDGHQHRLLRPGDRGGPNRQLDGQLQRPVRWSIAAAR